MMTSQLTRENCPPFGIETESFVLCSSPNFLAITSDWHSDWQLMSQTKKIIAKSLKTCRGVGNVRTLYI